MSDPENPQPQVSTPPVPPVGPSVNVRLDLQIALLKTICAIVFDAADRLAAIQSILEEVTGCRLVPAQESPSGLILPSSETAARPVRTCRVCGCTDVNRCRGGCFWVEDNLCSRCAGLTGGLGPAPSPFPSSDSSDPSQPPADPQSAIPNPQSAIERPLQ